MSAGASASGGGASAELLAKRPHRMLKARTLIRRSRSVRAVQPSKGSGLGAPDGLVAAGGGAGAIVSRERGWGCVLCPRPALLSSTPRALPRLRSRRQRLARL